MHLGWFATVPQLAAVLLDEGAQGMGAASVVVTPDPSQNALLKTRPAPVESSTSRLYPSRQFHRTSGQRHPVLRRARHRPLVQNQEDRFPLGLLPVTEILGE